MARTSAERDRASKPVIDNEQRAGGIVPDGQIGNRGGAPVAAHRSVFTNFSARSITADADRASGGNEVDSFVADLARLLFTFFAVVVIDALVISLLTQRLRLWFPQWLDPQWAARPDPWVVYSQSYFAGIFLIPFLCRLVDRDFLASAGAGVRGTFWSLCLIAFAFVFWWKGSLMLEYQKHYEALAWAALTAVMWAIIRLAEILPERIGGLTRRRILGGLLFGISLFFLVMSVLDPLVQLGVQRLPWTSGLTIEVGFFISAGLVLLTLSRRLRTP